MNILTNYINFDETNFYESTIISTFFSKKTNNFYIIIEGIEEMPNKKKLGSYEFEMGVIECINVEQLNLNTFISEIEISKVDIRDNILSIFDENDNFLSEKEMFSYIIFDKSKDKIPGLLVKAEKFNLVNLGVFNWLTYKISDISFLIEKLDRPTGIDMQQ